MAEKKVPSLKDVVSVFHEIFPPELAEAWDSSGLVVGRKEAPVARVGFAVDATVATAREAVEKEAGLLITHHPLLLRGASFLPDTDYKGEIIHTLIESSCALLGAHTNVDSAPYGTNETFMNFLGVRQQQRILAEEKLTLIDGREIEVGIGRVGELPRPVSLRQLAEKIATFLPATAGGLQVAGDENAAVQRVALCTGSGDSLFARARAVHADVYITADLRHHPASEFREQTFIGDGRPYLINCSHFASEWVWMRGAARLLTTALAHRGFAISTYVSELNTDPWDFNVPTGSTEGSASTRSSLNAAEGGL